MCAIPRLRRQREEPSIWGKGNPAINPNTAHSAVPCLEHRPGRRRRGQKRKHVSVDGQGAVEEEEGEARGDEGNGIKKKGKKRRRREKTMKMMKVMKMITTTRTMMKARREKRRGATGGKGAGKGRAGKAGGRDKASESVVALRQWAVKVPFVVLVAEPCPQHRQHAQSRSLCVLPVGQAEVHPRGPAAVRQMQAERAGRRVRVPR